LDKGSCEEGLLLSGEREATAGPISGAREAFWGVGVDREERTATIAPASVVQEGFDPRQIFDAIFRMKTPTIL